MSYERSEYRALYIHTLPYILRAYARLYVRICVRVYRKYWFIHYDRNALPLSHGCVLCFINIHAPYAVQRSVRIAASPRAILDSLALILPSYSHPVSIELIADDIDLSHSRPPSLNAPLVTKTAVRILSDTS